jgi:hypothetical protein
VRRRILLALCATTSLLLPAAAAQAGTLSVSGTTITYTAAPGEENFFTVNWGNVGAGPDHIPAITDHVQITPTEGCELYAGSYQCPSAGTNPTVIARLGDRNDIASSTNDHATGHHVELYGEDGDDNLDSDGSSDLLDGGNGNDEMSPDDDDPSGGDVVVGGPGEDTLQTGNPTGGQAPIGVSFDGVANDGYVNEADNYAPDLENLSATGTSPPINFVGNDARNVVQMRSESADTIQGLGGDDLIDAANGNDSIDGGAGNDTIYGGGNDDTIVGGPGLDSMSGEGSSSGTFTSVAGNDRIDARDGVAEQLNCGLGADVAIVDGLDLVPQDPGSLCESVDRPPTACCALPPAQKRAMTIRSTSLRYTTKTRRIAVTVACPAGGATCKGRLTLKTAAKVRIGKRRKTVTLGTASYSVAAGKSKSYRLKVSKDGRSLLKRTRSVKTVLSVALTGGKTTTKRLTVRR